MSQVQADSRWEGFYVYENPDRQTFHILVIAGDGGYILVIAGDGGYIFADDIQSREDADWAADVLTAALSRPSQ